MYDDKKEKVIDAAIQAFNKDGSHFTMDEVAASLGMSKKTIYKMFNSKDDLIDAAINKGFDEVKLAENKIINDPDIPVIDKIKRTIIVIPDQYHRIDWRRLYEFKEVYPKAYATIQSRIETGWEGTLALLQKGIDDGTIKNVNLPILKSMIESCIEGFLRNDTLIANNIGYEEALECMINIITEGLKK